VALIPCFNADGQLPEGIHESSWIEFCERFGHTAHRRSLLSGLEKLLRHLHSVGCSAVYVDGSFVSAKEQPNDYDACWDTRGVKVERIDGTLMSFTDEGKAKMQEHYKGDIRPAECSPQERNVSYLEFFQMDKDGNKKGIVKLVSSEVCDDKK
jgi:hypothetical protein